MIFLYNIAIQFTSLILPLASNFSNKLKLGVTGRKQTFKTLQNSISPKDKTLWFHCASLGEYEQGLPVFKAIKTYYPEHKIVLSFFSPSGYEIRKNNAITNITVYLPLDTKHNAKHFINFIKPELTVFVKYDIWPNYLYELKKYNLKAILISALFRKQQSFFKFYGLPLRRALFTFNHIFTQNEESKTLLKTINYNSVTISGDTRFDRVYNQLKTDNTLKFVEDFKQDKICLIAGSTWPEDEKLLVDYINNNTLNGLKIIIAPHNIKPQQIKKLKQSINVEAILFSEIINQPLFKYKVLILDTIGLLSKSYSYANIAYIGGAIGNTGLHNTLEPAVFGIPIIIGHQYQKFPEAAEMIKLGGMFSVFNQKQFNTTLETLINNNEKRKETGLVNANYIKKNTGAVIQIISFLRK